VKAVFTKGTLPKEVDDRLILLIVRQRRHRERLLADLSAVLAGQRQLDVKSGRSVRDVHEADRRSIRRILPQAVEHQVVEPQALLTRVEIVVPREPRDDLAIGVAGAAQSRARGVVPGGNHDVAGDAWGIIGQGIGLVPEDHERALCARECEVRADDVLDVDGSTRRDFLEVCVDMAEPNRSAPAEVVPDVPEPRRVVVSTALQEDYLDVDGHGVHVHDLDVRGPVGAVQACYGRRHRDDHQVGRPEHGERPGGRE